MKQKITIAAAVLLLIVVLLLMAKDMFVGNEAAKTNPYEYSIDNFKDIDTAQYCYSETNRFVPLIQKLNGIAIDADDNLYLTGLQKVMIYNKHLQFQKDFMINEEAKNIAVSETNEIYLGFRSHVEVWNSEGKFLKRWPAFNERSVLTSIVIGEKSVFVADAGNKVVLEYNFEGQLIKEIGKKDTINGSPGFFIPSPYFDLAIGREGELWAVNSGMHAFQSYNANGKFISSWESTSMQLDGFSGCCNPSHIAILSNGSFVTSEKGLVRVKIHAPSGDFKCVVAGPDAFDDDTRGIDLAVNSNDNIFIIVPNKKEVRVYKSMGK